MIKKQIAISNVSGLHARPAAKFAQAAAKFKSSIQIEYNTKLYNAKSIISVLSGGIGYGSTIELVVDGEDEENAINTLIKLIEDRLGE